MPFQPPITIKDAMENIHTNRYLLPAIQREFVWRPDQIERLFDSLMRGYPIGSFMFWRVDPATAKEYKFYDFMTDYDQRNPHNPERGAPRYIADLKAVLDGQQRLTALNLGLHGCGRWKLPRRWWNNPDAFPERRLYVNLLAPLEQDGEKLIYEFRLLRDKDAERRTDRQHWYLVGDILDIENPSDLKNTVQDLGLTDQPKPLELLEKLHSVVHSDPIISAYEETDQSPDRVLNIFVRANRGGTPLKHSDMLLSMVVNQWENVNARKEIHALVDEIRELGFSFDHSFVLKACLILGDSDSIRYDVENFSKSRIGALEDQWDCIRRTITGTVKLVSSFGYSGQSLTSTNALLPIAYYLHDREPSPGSANRKAIRNWLIRSLLKRGVWSGGTDNLLVAIRKAIREAPPRDGFPAQAIEEAMRGRGKGLIFDDEDLQGLANSAYGGGAHSLLLLLYSFVDTATNLFHVDHIFPRGKMSPAQLRLAGVDEEDIPGYRDRVNRLANLQLLTDSKNRSKGDKLPADWLHSQFSEEERRVHCNLHDLGVVPEKVTDFVDFYERRRTRILEKLHGRLVEDDE